MSTKQRAKAKSAGVPPKPAPKPAATSAAPTPLSRAARIAQAAADPGAVHLAGVRSGMSQDEIDEAIGRWVDSQG